jgi:hypothetical protein
MRNSFGAAIHTVRQPSSEQPRKTALAVCAPFDSMRASQHQARHATIVNMGPMHHSTEAGLAYAIIFQMGEGHMIEEDTVGRRRSIGQCLHRRQVSVP